jgi:hypothetical protein
LTDQTGAHWQPDACWVDEQGAVLFSARTADDSRMRVGVLHDHDLDLFADFIDDDIDAHATTRFIWRKDRILPMNPIRADDVARQFGFVRSPAGQAVHSDPP